MEDGVIEVFGVHFFFGWVECKLQGCLNKEFTFLSYVRMLPKYDVTATLQVCSVIIILLQYLRYI